MKQEEMDLLFGKLMGKSVCDVELWKKLFAEYDAVMDEKRKEQYLRVLRGTFDPESRRLLFCDLVPDLYSDEEAYLQGIERTEHGVEELYKYLRLNVNCFYGWRMLFFEFGKFLTREMEDDMVAYLKRNVPIMVLEVELPEIFAE